MFIADHYVNFWSNAPTDKEVVFYQSFWGRFFLPPGIFSQVTYTGPCALRRRVQRRITLANRLRNVRLMWKQTDGQTDRHTHRQREITMKMDHQRNVTSIPSNHRWVLLNGYSYSHTHNNRYTYLNHILTLCWHHVFKRFHTLMLLFRFSIFCFFVNHTQFWNKNYIIDIFGGCKRYKTLTLL